MNQSSRLTTKVGIAAIAAGAIGCLSLPSLFELCTVGVISGPKFVAIVIALGTLLGAGAQLLLARNAKGPLFVVSATLFLLCILGDASAMRSIPLVLAALGSLGGTVFTILRWRWRRVGLE